MPGPRRLGAERLASARTPARTGAVFRRMATMAQTMVEPTPNTQSVADRFPVVDVDTHVTEPPDLWTSRVSSKWGNLVPHVAPDPKTGRQRWWIGETKL